MTTFTVHYATNATNYKAGSAATVEAADTFAAGRAVKDAHAGYVVISAVTPADFKPSVGMGGSWRGYSDTHAVTVIAVSKSGKKVTVQEDTAKLLNGSNSDVPDALQFSPGGFCGHTSGQQRYEFSRNTEGATSTYSIRKNGTWIQVGDSIKGRSLDMGTRSHHYDFNF